MLANIQLWWQNWGGSDFYISAHLRLPVISLHTHTPDHKIQTITRPAIQSLPSITAGSTVGTKATPARTLRAVTWTPSADYPNLLRPASSSRSVSLISPSASLSEALMETTVWRSKRNLRDRQMSCDYFSICPIPTQTRPPSGAHYDTGWWTQLLLQTSEPLAWDSVHYFVQVLQRQRTNNTRSHLSRLATARLAKGYFFVTVFKLY